jgi:hypothetical protein
MAGPFLDFDLPAEGVLHDIEALEESAFLLTIAWPDSR